MFEPIPVARVDLKSAEEEAARPLDLPELEERQRAVLAALDREISATAARLVALLPEEVSGFTSEAFHPSTNFLATILKYGRSEHKIKEPSDYGFKSNRDVVAKMRLIKERWAGIMDVRISFPSGAPYVTVVFRPAEKEFEPTAPDPE
jgi:hypothetical protein